MRAPAAAEIGRAYVIIKPPRREGVEKESGSELGEKGHVYLLIERPAPHAPIFLSFAPADPTAPRDIGRFTAGSVLHDDYPVFCIEGLNTDAMAAYVNELSAHLCNRDTGWGYDRVRHNCTQVTERALSEGGFTTRRSWWVGTPSVLREALTSTADRERIRIAALESAAAAGGAGAGAGGAGGEASTIAATASAGAVIPPERVAKVTQSTLLASADTIRNLRRNETIPAYRATAPLSWWERLRAANPRPLTADARPLPPPGRARAVVRLGLDPLAAAEARGDGDLGFVNPMSAVSGTEGRGGAAAVAPSASTSRAAAATARTNPLVSLADDRDASREGEGGGEAAEAPEMKKR